MHGFVGGCTQVGSAISLAKIDYGVIVIGEAHFGIAYRDLYGLGLADTVCSFSLPRATALAFGGGKISGIQREISIYVFGGPRSCPIFKCFKYLFPTCVGRHGGGGGF